MVSPQRSAGQSIARVITRSAATTMILMLVAIAVLIAQHQWLLTVTAQIDPALSANRQILQSMTESESAMRGYLLTQETAVVAPYQKNRQALADGFTTLRQSDVAELGDLPQRQQKAAEVWLFDYAGPFIRAKQRPSVAKMNAAQAAFAVFAHINTQITDKLHDRRTTLANRSALATGLAIALVVVVSLVAAAVLIRRGRHSLSVIGPPLADLQQMLLSRRAGDLELRANTEVGVSEVRGVAKAINQMIDSADRQRTRLAEELRLAEGIRQLGLTIGARMDVGDILESAAGELAIALHTHVIWMRAFSGEGSVPGVGAGTMYPTRAGFTTNRDFVAHARRVASLALARKTACLLSPDHPEQTGFIERHDGEQLLASIKKSTGSESLLFVGVGAGLECLGYIGLTRAPGQPAWSISERSAAVLAGQQIGQAILNGRLFQREQQLVDEMKALDERKNDFVSTVSHELRTPLASIMGYLELIRAGDLGEVSPSIGQSLGAIDRNSKRLQLLIEDLLLLSQVEDRELRPAPMLLDAMVAETVADRKAARQNRADDLELHLDGPLSVLGEQRELARVVDNLVENAIKFSQPGTKIIVSTRAVGGQAELTVQDHGLGISEADQTQLFRRFFRSAEVTSRALPGTGLGLSIVKLIIDKHRGTIEVASRSGQGTTMTVRVPLQQDGFRSGRPRAENAFSR